MTDTLMSTIDFAEAADILKTTLGLKGSDRKSVV